MSVLEAISHDIENEFTLRPTRQWIRPFLQLRKDRGDFYVAVWAAVSLTSNSNVFIVQT